MSGDMCTSLGNGFTNMMLALFIAKEKHGHLEGVVEGDDGLFSSSVELTKEDYAELGFSIKIESISDPCRASFCGMIFADSGEIIRDPVRFLSTFGWTTSFITAGSCIMDQLLRAKALSAVYETPQCPIVGALARFALSRTRGVVPRFIHDGYHVCHDEVALPDFAPSDDTRELFSQLYSVPIPLQKEIEKAIQCGDMDRVALLLPSPTDLSRYCSDYVIVT